MYLRENKSIQFRFGRFNFIKYFLEVQIHDARFKFYKNDQKRYVRAKR